MKKVLIFSCLLLLKAPCLFAQDISMVTIQWNCSSTTDTMNGLENGEETTLITAPGSIVWKEPNGNVRKSFVVEKVLTPWTDIYDPGIVQYYVRSQNEYGVLTIEYKAGERKATIVLGNEEPRSFELRISSFQKL